MSSSRITSSSRIASSPRIAVIGLGATGSAALLALARRGVRALGIEQFALGHDRGSSHGPTRVIRLAHFENAAYVPLMRRAYALWRELETDAQEPLLRITGILEIGPASGELVPGTLAAARRYELAHEVLDAASLMRRFPAYRLPEDFVAVLQPDGGYIGAAAALGAMIKLARAAGAEIRTNERVVTIDPHGAGVLLKTDRNTIEADGAIMAAGPWMNALLPGLSLPLRVTRQVVGWFAPNDPAPFAAERFPVFLIESRHGMHYGFPYCRGIGANMGIKVAKHHHLGEVVAPDHSGDRRIAAADEAVIRAPLADYLPGADGRLVAAQTCLYTMTPDDTFIVDRLPGFPQVVIASPCCGHGFKFAPVIGEITADLVTTGTTTHDIAPFRLQQFDR
jgi:sarcosine oxidase